MNWNWLNTDKYNLHLDENDNWLRQIDIIGAHAWILVWKCENVTGAFITSYDSSLPSPPYFLITYISACAVYTYL